MAGSTRIKGNKLGLTVGATNFWCDASSVVLDNEESDSDVTTFCDAAEGGARTWFFTITAIQSTQAGSFWRYLWANSGNEVSFVYAPHGNTTATEDQPHFTGTLKVGPKPSVGGEAGTNTTFTFETRLDVIGEPSMVPAIPVTPAITTIEPSTVAVAGGTLVKITGSGFLGVTGAASVKFGTVNATSYVVDDNNTIYATAPAQAAGSKNVTVINTGGTSNVQAVTYV